MTRPGRRDPCGWDGDEGFDSPPPFTRLKRFTMKRKTEETLHMTQFQGQGPFIGPKKIPAGCQHVNQHYNRTLPRGSGAWYCNVCASQRSPLTDQGDTSTGFTFAEAKKLDALRHLHTNEGFGTAFRNEPVIACVLPEPGDTLVTA